MAPPSPVDEIVRIELLINEPPYVLPVEYALLFNIVQFSNVPSLFIKQTEPPCISL